jgi:hypothetical protein
MGLIADAGSNLQGATLQQRIDFMKRQEDSIQRTRRAAQQPERASKVSKEQSQDDEVNRLMTYRSSTEKPKESNKTPDQSSPRGNDDGAGSARRPGGPHVKASKLPLAFQVKRAARPNFPAHVLKDLERVRREAQSKGAPI